MAKRRIRVFVEGDVLVIDHFSGIGHYTAALLQEVDKLLDEDAYSHISIEIGLPSKLAHRISRFGFKNFSFKKVPLSHRLTNGLKKRGLLPPIDLLYGKRTYVFPHFSSWPTIRSPQIPIIYDLSFVLHPEFSAESNATFLVNQTQLSVDRASRIITISDNSMSEIAKQYNFPVELIDKVTPLLDTKIYRQRAPHETNYIRAKYGIFDEFILFVGNIEPRKNLVSLLRAYEQLDPALQKKYSLLLVGAKGWRDGEIYEQITQMREKGLKVLLPSSYIEDDDISAIYTAARAFAYVSVYEGYGIPPTEAMACGTAVIASDNSSLPEAVEDAAIMVNALKINEITAALHKVLSSDTVTNKLIEKGFQRVKRLKSRDSAVAFLKSIQQASATGNKK